MNSCFYRNVYYVKESIADFFQSKKKYLFWSIIALVIGISFGCLVGLKNASCYNFINLTDKILFGFLSGKSFLYLFLRSLLYYAFLTIIILIINNFSFLTILDYFLFAYLSFNQIYNAIIICNLLKISGVLYSILCYVPLKLAIIFLLITIFLLCKSSNDCGKCNSNFSTYPTKAILLSLFLIAILCLIFSLLTSFWLKFIKIFN